MQAAPMARLQQGKQAAVTTGKAGTTGIPCAMVLTAAPRSPRCTGLYSHRRLARRVGPKADIANSQSLTPASGGQDHTAWPSAKMLSSARQQRAEHLHVHRIPLPTSVTIAIRPSGGGG